MHACPILPIQRRRLFDLLDFLLTLLILVESHASEVGNPANENVLCASVELVAIGGIQ